MQPILVPPSENDPDSQKFHLSFTLQLVLAGVLLMTQIMAQKPSVAASINDLRCLAQNIYYEARGEPDSGKLAVALVTLNRVKSTKFPNTVCGVVWQEKQFSWTHSLSASYPPNGAGWHQAKKIARLALAGARYSLVGAAMHFHATHVNPKWARAKQPVAQVGGHLFYVL